MGSCTFREASYLPYWAHQVRTGTESLAMPPAAETWLWCPMALKQCFLWAVLKEAANPRVAVIALFLSRNFVHARHLDAAFNTLEENSRMVVEEVRNVAATFCGRKIVVVH